MKMNMKMTLVCSILTPEIVNPTFKILTPIANLSGTKINPLSSRPCPFASLSSKNSVWSKSLYIFLFLLENIKQFLPELKCLLISMIPCKDISNCLGFKIQFLFLKYVKPFKPY